MYFDYEQKMITGLYLIGEKQIPPIKKRQIFEIYQIYYNLVRDEQLIKEDVKSLGHVISKLGPKYEKYMTERVDRAWYYTLEEITKK